MTVDHSMRVQELARARGTLTPRILFSIYIALQLLDWWLDQLFP